MDCKHLRVVIACRLTARPRIIAWSLTIPFNALKAFFAYNFTFTLYIYQKLVLNRGILKKI